MNELIPLMVIVPLMAALLISAFSKFNTVTKIFAFVVAICLPIIPLLSNYGLHYFGGYEPMINDAVNHPSHYTDGGIETIDFIEAKRLPYHLGNAVKYISRAGKKDQNKTIEDLQKAVWYIERYIKVLEGE